MALPDWVALHSYKELAGDPAWPWDESPADDGPAPDVVAEAEEYLRQHSALREP